MNSLDTAIIKRVEDKYEALDGIEQGGITYLDFSLDEMFNMSDVVITLLQELLKLLVEHINAVTERLAEVQALSRRTPLLILNGFTKCSVTEFFGLLELMINTERVIQLYNDGDRHDNRKYL